MKEASPKRQLEGFLGKFSPEVAATARAALRKMRKLVPGAFELVYDNYNALAIGFSSTEKQAGLACSIAVYPRWVSLFLMHGPKLRDPKKLLKGSGTTVRHIVLDSAETLDDRAVRDLLSQALKRTKPPIDPKGRSRILIKSVSAKQRPRR
jgi:hypothetical protein